MSIEYTYTRNRKRLVVFNGTFDPCQDNIEMGANWHNTQDKITTPLVDGWSVVTAPSAIGGYAHKLTTTTTIGASSTSPYYYAQITPFRGYQYGKQLAFPLFSPQKFSMKTEFRMYIEADVTSTDVNYKLAGSAVFCLDGAAELSIEKWALGNRSMWNRICVAFNVASQKAGITSSDKYNGSLYNDLSRQKTLHSVDWTGSYNTWYDIRIEWSYDLYTSPLVVSVTVYVNKTLLFSYDVPILNWRTISAGTITYERGSYNANLGRVGYGVQGGKAPGLSAGNVTAYFKDILLSVNDIRDPVEWTVNDSILLPNAEIEAEGLFQSEDPKQLCKGSDVQFWFRNSSTDDWNNFFRGRVRDLSRPTKKLVLVSAEDYTTIFATEKLDNHGYTAQTAAQIFKDVIEDHPYRIGVYDAETFFDTVTATYTRAYFQVPKVDVLFEMVSLEDFICFLDYGKNWHFQKPRTNLLNKHLIFGESKIRNYLVSAIDIRKPNVLRLLGTNVMTERELIDSHFTSETRTVKTISRLDITSASVLDDVADYYAALYREELTVLEIEMRADYDLKKGYIIAVTIPDANYTNTKFLITAIQTNHAGLMKLTLLEAKPGLSLLLSELVKTTDRTESTYYETDTATSTKEVNLGAIATLLITATYEIYNDAALVSSGDMIITDKCIDFLLDMLINTTFTRPTHFAYGTGTTPATYADTAIETLTGSTTAPMTFTLADKILDYTAAADKIYRSITFSEIESTTSKQITELGLLNGSAGSGDLFARAVFDAVTIENFEFKITFSFDILPSSSFPTFNLANKLVRYFNDGSWTNIGEIRAAEGLGVTSPTPLLNGEPDINHVFKEWTDFAYGSSTKTVIKYRDEVKIEYSGTYPSVLTVNDGIEQGFVLNDTVATDGKLIVALRPTGTYFENNEDHDFYYVFWFRILRSDISQ